MFCANFEFDWWKNFIKWCNNSNTLEGKIVLVTGSGSGIGRQLALELAHKKAKIILWDINDRGNEETANLVKNKVNGAELFPFTCDVSNRDDVYRIAQMVKNNVGVVDILINNAGIFKMNSLLNIDDNDIIRTTSVNCLAHVWTVKAFLPDMIKMNNGHIVTISSAAGMLAMSEYTSYTMTKFAAVGFHKALSAELYDKGFRKIKMTLICPLFAKTTLWQNIEIKPVPIILPILKPEYVAKRIVDAIKNGERFVTMPRFTYIMFIFERLAPTWMYNRFASCYVRHCVKHETEPV